jgi:hypothetical protein
MQKTSSVGSEIGTILVACQNLPFKAHKKLLSLNNSFVIFNGLLLLVDSIKSIPTLLKFNATSAIDKLFNHCSLVKLLISSTVSFAIFAVLIFISGATI